MDNIFRQKQIEVLAECISKSIELRDFSWDKFFKLWFRENGNPLFFLFKKNLSVTNTQYLEIFSLIPKHCIKKYSDNSDKKLLFYSTEHVKSTFTEIINTLLENLDGNEKECIDHFSSMYLDVFSSSITVDMFYGSCAIFLPPGISVDLERIVHDSGYIHTAGKSIFIRNIKKAKKNNFIQNLETYLTSHTENKIPFIIYAHEDFDGWDKESSDQLERGIEHCKIFVDKMSMGSHRLGSILQEMKTNPILNKKLHIPNPGNYQKEHKFKKKSTVWLISDKSISSNSIKNSGANRYYICYEQILKNESPFYFFDENKPAWKSHTTLPQSLTSALINIANPNGVGCKIVDPFGGTGTTWLEVKRLQLNSDINSSDLSPITQILHKDNCDFFKLSATEILKLRNELLSFTNMDLRNLDQFDLKFDGLDDTKKSYRFAIELLDKLKEEQRDEDQEYFISEIYAQKLKEEKLLDRIVFYLTLRAQIRFQAALERGSITFENAFKKSLKGITDQINLFLKLRKNVELEIENGTAIENSLYIKYLSNYSYSIISKFFIDNTNDTTNQIATEVSSSKDARLIDSNSYDLIICDPPYGFNTTENSKDLMDLYSKFIDVAISGLKKHGQLIICLPAESYTGKDLPFCTRADLISRQIILKANKQNRQVYRPTLSLPTISLSPPYYWESEKALRRTILHFCFQ